MYARFNDSAGIVVSLDRIDCLRLPLRAHKKPKFVGVRVWTRFLGEEMKSKTVQGEVDVDIKKCA
jgi:hypothetical protein